jgi:hypothetical protein
LPSGTLAFAQVLKKRTGPFRQKIPTGLLSTD